MRCKSPVLLIFFNRPDSLQETFNEIKKAQPPRLYLAQDGPRVGNVSDQQKIQECRKIVEKIDWECEVFLNYSDENKGCGMRPYSAIQWFFGNEESGIILEDDCVASTSFFHFCDEMLQRYKDDERVFLITGCNAELKSEDVNDSYFFGYSGTNCGWASWRRCWQRIDYACSWIKNRYVFKNLRAKLIREQEREGRKEIKYFLNTYKRLSDNENISYWDAQWQAVRYLENQLSIIPKCNMITNIGLGPESTHAKNTKIPKKLHNIVGKVNFTYNERFEMEFPLKHPEYVIRNAEYDRKVNKKLAPSLIKKILIKLKLLGA